MKKTSASLLILMFSVPILTGIVHPASVPTITATGGYGSGIVVQGSSWTKNQAVTIYWDTEDESHKVAQTTANTGGQISVAFPFGNPTVGAHTVIAVQGSNRATTPFIVGATSPPDDRLLTPINSIMTFLQTGVSSDLLIIRNKLDAVDSEITAVEAKLDVGGSFYNFVNEGINNIGNKLTIVGSEVTGIVNTLMVGGSFYNFVNEGINNIGNKLNNVENKLIDIGQKIDAADAEVMLYSNSGNFTNSENGVKEIISIFTDHTCVYTVTIGVDRYDDKDDWTCAMAWFGSYSNGAGLSNAPIVAVRGGLTFGPEIRTATFAGGGMWMMHYNEDGSSRVYWAVTVEGPPDTIVSSSS